MNFEAIVKGHRYMLGVVCRNEAGSYLVTLFLSFFPLPDLGMSNFIHQTKSTTAYDKITKVATQTSSKMQLTANNSSLYQQSKTVLNLTKAT